MKTQTEVLAIIPARGGSKGIKKKCIRDLAGKPLIAYTIEAALRSTMVTRVVVSTDDPEIAGVAASFGAEVPFLRPAELATDLSPTLPVLIHAINYLAAGEGYSPELVVLLQPTSPLRDHNHIDEAVTKLVEAGAESVVSLTGTKIHPYWMKRLEGDRVFDLVENPADVSRRQDLPPVYRLNGAIYVTRYGVIMEQNRLLGEDTRGYVMDEVFSVDIDTPIDLIVAQALLKERMKVENHKDR